MDGIQRLAEMLEGQEDKALIKVVNYLMLQKEMEQDFLKEEKKLKDMAEYIKGKAMKEATNGWNWLDDEVVFEWAKEYFMKSNKELGIKKYKLEKGKHGDVSRVEIKDDEFGSIFGTQETVVENKKNEIEQISLFGM